MSLERTPLNSVQSIAASEQVSIASSSCQACNEILNEGDECLLISDCSHPFHRNCIETLLSTTSECPVCHRPCQLNELKKLIIAPKPIVHYKTNTARGGGVLAKQYHTRSASRNIRNNTNLNTCFQPEGFLTPSRNGLQAQDQSLFEPSVPPNPVHAENSQGIDYVENN